MRIALLGGSFNPPHIGHLMAAIYVRAVRGVDEVWLLPSFHHPFGKSLETFEHRFSMCEAMAKDHRAWLKVSDFERSLGGEGRTVDTLEALSRSRPNTKFELVIGSDILKDLPHWKAWDRIQQLATVVVLHRAGYPAAEAEGPPLAEVSSTDIRAKLEKGEVPEGLVAAQVVAYAQRHGLYGFEKSVVRAAAMSRRQIRVVGAMLEKEPGTYLITQRAKDASLPLLWEFPGGRVQDGEDDRAALVREVKERLKLDIVVNEQAMATHHVYPSYEVDFRVFSCTLKTPDQSVSHHRVNDHRWVGLEQMGQFQFPAADARTLEKLLDLDH